ncbi:uncharacterized protein N7503_010275 [Penicillium pulvis]|uniref:uncharacterized protein n=1 Tax=Penicillium pulvis TaxID=1562058 RepID=UPI0025475C09|nr:uncharacterized protein N7503_010275 [Penicillium pulvis]KAJ5785063.1 hypothetical protein N7503_010275 [Penicillium pulvis]
MPETNKVHIFGGLWLPDPDRELPRQELLYVRKLLNLIQRAGEQQLEEAKGLKGKISAIQYTPAQNNHKADLQNFPEWNLIEAFEIFRKKEVGWWKERGVIRPGEYLVRPSGHTNAAVACHLYNPTFSVNDPLDGETEDLTNPSVAQLNRAGFSTRNNCLLFDHLARRDISRHCKEIYPEDLFDIHEEFTFALRAAMKAKVEICWGANVRQRMLKKLDLEPLRLWGDFTGLTLYLELTSDKKNWKRFVIFVAHPQRFMYVKSDGERAQAWRRRFGASQDRALTLAAELSGIQISPNFYELDVRLPQNICVPRRTSARKNAWKGQAVAQLKEVFPDAILSTESSHRIRATKEDKAALLKVLGVLGKFEPSRVSQTVNGPRATDDKTLRNLRSQKIVNFWHGLKNLAYAFIPNADTNTYCLRTINAHTISYLSDKLPAELQRSDCWDWEDLPASLVEFIQVQDGLKFNKRKIMCRTDLEVAFYLLQRCEGNPEVLDILTLAFAVLAAYGWMITRPRKPLIDNMLVLRESPNDVIARKCSGCKREQLDDPFAYWSKSDPDCYALWYYFRSNCGRPECTTQNVSLLPLDNLIRYSRATHSGLEAKRLDRFERWFLLHPEEYGVLPGQLKVKCQGEGCQETRLVKSRWTAHATPRFVVAVHKCAKSLKRTNWVPSGYPTVHAGTLSVLWKRFHEHPGFEITEYPRRPDIYFNTSLSIAGRIASLIEAQRLLENRSNNRKRKASEMTVAEAR